MDARDSRKPPPRALIGIALLVLVACGLLVALGPLKGLLPGTQTPDAQSESSATATTSPEPATASEPSGWTIAYVTEGGIETRHEDGQTSFVATTVGERADWAPDRAHVTMLAYNRADMAYTSDLAIVSYPSGEIVVPFRGLAGQIDYYGWTADSTSVIWSNLSGAYYLLNALTGAEEPVATPENDPYAPPQAAPDVADALVAAVTAALEPPADAGTFVRVTGVWPRSDGAALLTEVEVWRNADKETALMERVPEVWMANVDGTGARRVALGHSPVWLSP